MRLEGLGREGSRSQTYLVDANVFLELELDRKRASECELLLRRVRDGTLKASITDFHLDTVLIIMENYGKSPAELRVFLSSLFGFKGLDVYFLSVADRVMATKHMEKLKLDLDDALAYQAMKRLGLSQIVSYDKHFNLVPAIKRLEPSELIRVR